MTVSYIIHSLVVLLCTTQSAYIAENKRLKFRVPRRAIGRMELSTEWQQEFGLLWHWNCLSERTRTSNYPGSLKREKRLQLWQISFQKQLTAQREQIGALWSHHLGCFLPTPAFAQPHCRIKLAEKIMNRECSWNAGRWRAHRPPCIFVGSAQDSFLWGSSISVRVEVTFWRTKAKPSPTKPKSEASFKDGWLILGLFS